MWMERRVPVRLMVMCLTSLASACTSLPPQTATELAVRLASGRTLFDAKETAEVLGVTELKRGAPTRVNGVTLYQYGPPSGIGENTRSVYLGFPGTCLSLADMTWRFGDPSKFGIVIDGGGVFYY